MGRQAKEAELTLGLNRLQRRRAVYMKNREHSTAQVWSRKRLMAMEAARHCQQAAAMLGAGVFSFPQLLLGFTSVPVSRDLLRSPL